MEPDNDPQLHALEASPETPPVTPPAHVAQHSSESAAKSPNAETPQAGSPRRPLFRRLLEACGKPFAYLKGLLQPGVGRIFDAGRGLLQRLRNRGTPPAEERGADKRQDEKSREPRATRKKEEPPASVEQPQTVAPRSPVRSVFLYLLVLILGTIAGMTFSFALLSKIITNQAEKIGDQRDEIAKIETEHSNTLLSEAKYRLESMESKKRLSEVESQLRTALQNAKGITPPPPPETRTNPTAPATVKPPGSAKPGDCVLDSGKVGDNLARCINNFNRR